MKSRLFFAALAGLVATVLTIFGVCAVFLVARAAFLLADFVGPVPAFVLIVVPATFAIWFVVAWRDWTKEMGR